MKIILGIDPGVTITGYGLVQKIGNEIHYLSSGCIRTNTNKNNFPLKLKLIYTSISTIIKKFSPKYCAIEQIFVSKNINSALKLGQARGAAIIAAINYNLSIFEYSACQVKQAVTGYGHAEKKQVQYMVCRLLNIKHNLTFDETDALAIAITYSNIKNM